MHMPDMPKVHFGGAHTSHNRFMRPNPMFVWFVLIESLYWAGCAACFLFALHRIELIHKVKTHALGPF